ncbi:pilus assembly protein TadG-related protein [Pseudomonas gingeri]|uniref:pilus assembly protein TadG-related protein n=1 Tax=Pseudomonas gingeri TaxID=117681 RepID=UPI00159FAF37|nr:pilus assembly protein TadG-related protein [Pseudomonas gingeri]NWA06435.1 hypothetical protein [Pseudomonas gingeri]
MSFPHRPMAFRGPSRQRGAIGLMAALTLGLALLCMVVVVDSGRLYLEKRSLQRVADSAALEAMSRGGNCVAPDVTAASYANQNAVRNAFVVANGNRTLTTTCGTLVTGTNNIRTFSADATKSQAIRVVATKTVPTSIAAGIGALFSGTANLNTTLTATAVASPKPLPPLAQLTIRSTLVTVDSSKSAALNLLLGQMLGGNLNLSVAGWQGLVDTNINLLSYMNQLAIDLHLSAGDYNSVLSTNTTLTRLIDTAITVLTAGGTTTSIAVSGLTDLKAAVGNTQVKLGDLLKLQTATPSSGLDATLQVFQLVEAFVQLANTKNGAVASIPLSIPGLLNGGVKVQVIEPPQLSATGNPQTAVDNPNDPASQIYVRTAQVRTIVTLSLPVLDTPLVNGVLTGLVGTLSDTLNNLLHLNIVGALNSLLCPVSCQRTDLKVLPTASINIDLEVGSADSHVTGFTCLSDATKTLTTQTNASLVKVKVGSFDPSHAFDSSSDIVVAPLPLVDIGVVTCSLLGGCIPSTRVPFYGGGIGLSIDSTAGNATANRSTHQYNQPPEIKQPPQYWTQPTSNIVGDLTGALTGLKLNIYKPTGSNVLGSLLTGIGNVLNDLNTTLGGIISGVLTPLLNPILNGLLNNLGINLNQIEVGANLSCKPPGRAELVI